MTWAQSVPTGYNLLSRTFYIKYYVWSLIMFYRVRDLLAGNNYFLHTRVGGGFAGTAHWSHSNYVLRATFDGWENMIGGGAVGSLCKRNWLITCLTQIGSTLKVSCNCSHVYHIPIDAKRCKPSVINLRLLGTVSKLWLLKLVNITSWLCPCIITFLLQ